MEFPAAFLLGLVGSLHCGLMCGPLVLALVKSRPAVSRGWSGGFAYHFGRIVCYGLMGLLLGGLSLVAVPSAFQRWLSIGLGAGLLAGLLRPGGLSTTVPLMKWIGFLRRRVRELFQQETTLVQATLGALNGLLPCGLVYVAAAGAAATGHPIKGAGFMLAFGLGTWPMMLAVHLAGRRFPLPARLPLGNVVRGTMGLMAALLILRGLELGIPYLSPKLPPASGAAGRCH